MLEKGGKTLGIALQFFKDKPILGILENNINQHSCNISR
jgi:hypothetical protein